MRVGAPREVVEEVLKGGPRAPRVQEEVLEGGPRGGPGVPRVLEEVLEGSPGGEGGPGEEVLDPLACLPILDS